ncbi:transketolase [Holotrichia oblita]|uniref:Transketolase n=1 Tax=Holotrichia oblita TaxID=644536 RepID=A0ACB9TC95_HOLOL|nr:transketolase [Holotrichia oblita]
MASETKELSDIANKLRIDVLKAVATTGTGHPTSCSSIAEIIAVLFFKVMKYFVRTPKDPANDRLILSKGHAAPILYAAWAEIGHFPVDKLTNLRTLYSDLEGNPTPRLDFIDAATGSLGQGVPIAVGMAYVGKKIDTNTTYRVYCIVGDGECSEGVVWEAINFASYYKLDNLCIIVDVNRFGETGQTIAGADVDVYKKRFEAFDCYVYVVDGHNVDDVIHGFDSVSRIKEKPSVILAKTLKGKHYLPTEDSEGWHGKVLELDTDKCIKHLESLITCKTFTLKPQSPAKKTPKDEKYHVQLSAAPDYIDNRKCTTNLACANGLVKIAQSHDKVYVFDTDVSDITHSNKVKNYDSSRFIQCFSSNEAAVGIAIGANCRDRTIPFISTCGTLLTKAFDAIRLGAISKTNINICASHCGITVGEDGPVLMALEDLAMFRAIPGCTIFYPSDAVSTERAVELAANINGMTYIRTSRYPVPIIYNNEKLFRTGEAQILRNHPADKLLVICGGVTLHEVLAAEMQLSNDGLHIRVMDIFTVKPIDKEGIIKNAEDIGGAILTVEDHYAEGGLGEAVLAAVADHKIAVTVLAVPKIPRSGTSKELMDYFGISSANIVMTIKEMFGANY